MVVTAMGFKKSGPIGRIEMPQYTRRKASTNRQLIATTKELDNDKEINCSGIYAYLSQGGANPGQ
jgi:hypothetical protein